MRVTWLRVDRDDFLETAPHGRLGVRDPLLASATDAADPDSYEVLLDGSVIGVLADFRALSVDVEPGDHLLATRSLGAGPVISAVPFTVVADPDYDVTTGFICRSSGLLDGPDVVLSRATKVKRKRSV